MVIIWPPNSLGGHIIPRPNRYKEKGKPSKLLIFPSQIKRIEERAKELSETKSFVVRKAINQYFGIEISELPKKSSKKEELIIVENDIESLRQLFTELLKIQAIPKGDYQPLMDYLDIFTQTKYDSMKDTVLIKFVQFLHEKKLYEKVCKNLDIKKILNKIESKYSKEINEIIDSAELNRLVTILIDFRERFEDEVTGDFFNLLPLYEKADDYLTRFVFIKTIVIEIERLKLCDKLSPFDEGHEFLAIYEKLKNFVK